MNNIDSLFLLICTMFVMLMQVGFLLLESGIVRSKNSINVAAKNLIDLTLVLIVYWLVGFGLMFGASDNGYFGTSLFVIDSFNAPPFASFFLFQAMFCATATTVISGAIAERGSLGGYVTMTVLLGGVLYPIFGHWVWADASGLQTTSGWLGAMGFYDFAGSTVVHSMGGWVALAAIIIIGPRIGRFDNDNMVFRPHNLVYTVAGVIFLWIGWLGFNAGSQLTFDYEVLGIVLNTAIAAAAGGLVSLAMSSLIEKTIDVSWVCNGMLAGMVSITASCNIINIQESVSIGAVGAIICIALMKLLEKLKIDDVVQAVPVHLGAGIWGTLAVALFGDMSMLGSDITRLSQLKIQAFGIAVCAIWAFGVGFIVLFIVNKIIPLRVPAMSEIEGLNIVEHNAANEVHDLIYEMQQQEAESKFDDHVRVEPSTEIGQVAIQYNRILDRFNQATRDIYDQHSELKESHKKLQIMQAQLIQNEKMAGLGQLTAGIAHEINNPISFILQNIQSLDEYTQFFEKLITEYKAFVVAQSDGDGTAKEILSRIDEICREEDLDYVLTDSKDLIESTQKGVNRVSEIVRNMKTFSHPGSEKFTKTNIHQVLDSSLDIANSETKYNSEIIKEYKAKLNNIEANKSELIQVFLNLIVNASHAIGEENNGIIKIITENEGENIKVHIIDSGCGIRKDKLQHIFDPFFTTKEVGKGTGLGLSISYGIVKKHNGRIQVMSKPGKGTKFILTFKTTK